MGDGPCAPGAGAEHESGQADEHSYPEAVHIPQRDCSFTAEDASDWGRGVWLLESGTGAFSLLGKHKIKTAGISFSPDGNYLASCGWERELIFWDLRTKQRAFTCADAGYHLVWSADGARYGARCAMITRRNPRLQLFAFEPPACRQLSGNRGGHPRPGTFSPDGRGLALSDSQGLWVWDLDSRAPPTFLHVTTPPYPPFFSRDAFVENFVEPKTEPGPPTRRKD